MDKYAGRILKEQVAPKLDKLLAHEGGLSERELMHVKELTCIAKELLECDVYLKKLGKPDPMSYNKQAYPTMATPSDNSSGFMT